MASRYYNPKTGKVNYKAIEKAVGYKLSESEREYADFFYEEGSCYGKDTNGIPDFGSEFHADFEAMLLGCE